MLKRILICMAAASICITACKSEGKIENNYISEKVSVKPDKFNVYTIENDQVVPKSIGGEDLGAKEVIESVMLGLDDIIDDTEVDIQKQADSITVNFLVKDKDHPFGKKSKVAENQVLECISYSILDNFENYKKIYFKLNGEAYNTTQLKLSEDKPFMADE